MSKLLNFTVGNYRSFNENRTFTFSGAAGFNCVRPDDMQPVSNVSAVYGANSSGKSNLINAMSTMRRIMRE